MSDIGHLSWRACQECKHYRPEVGGCLPLDQIAERVLSADFETETVICLKYEEMGGVA